MQKLHAKGLMGASSQVHCCLLLLLLLLQKHSLSGLISSICCNLECIQITTFPCADHMCALRTEVALSLNRADRERRGEAEDSGEAGRGRTRGLRSSAARVPGVPRAGGQAGGRRAWLRSARGLRGAARGFRPVLLSTPRAPLPSLVRGSFLISSWSS